jgi:polysaccharide deacetylase family protein (PEP-CTERM system associated)
VNTATTAHPISNALTVDLEEYFQVSAFEGVIDRASWDDIPSRLEPGTRRILDLFDVHDVKATFFVLGWIAERHPAMVRELVERGHEVASHGYEHRLVSDLGREGFREDLRRASAAIEEAAGIQVRGFRAASFSISADTPWAFDVLCEEGYAWSSSVFPVRHDRYGIPDFPRYPVRVAGTEGRSLWEFPMTTWRVLGRNVPAAGGGWLRALPAFVMRRAIRAANDDGEPAIVYVHPWELDPDQPRVEGASWSSRFRHRLNLRKTGKRLARLLARFPFTTVSRVLASRT